MLKTCEPDRAGLPSTGVSGLQRGRASWTGILQFSLVAVPVKAYPATSTADTIGFNQLHARTARCPLCMGHLTSGRYQGIFSW